MPPIDIEHTADSESKQFWKEVYMEYFNAFVYYAYKIVDEWEGARDITSEVLTSMIIRRKDFNNKVSAVKYLYVTIRHACYQYREDRKKTALMSTELAICFPDVELRDVVLLHEALSLREVLKEIMEPLSPKEHTIIRMFYFENQSITQIAEAFGTSENSIRVQKARAIEKMRQKHNGLPESLLYGMLMIMSGLAF